MSLAQLLGAWIMSLAVCPGCRARYNVPATAAGKRTTCKKCGVAFRIPLEAAPPVAVPPPEPPSSGADLGLGDLEALASGQAIAVERSAEVTAPSAAVGPVADRALGGGSVAVAGPRGGRAHHDPEVSAYGHYIADVMQSLLFIRKPKNIVLFITLWLMLVVREFLQTAAGMTGYLLLPFVGTAWLVLSGWYMAFQMNLVTWAAGGEEELPSLAAEDGWWDGIVLPFFRLLTTYVVALLPALIYWMVLVSRIVAAYVTNPGAGSAVPADTTMAILVILVLFGMCAWPMMVLVVSVGGSVRGLLQLDLIIETVIKSLPAYLLTVAAVYLTLGLRGLVWALVWSKMSDKVDWKSDWASLVLLPAVFIAVNLYFEIAALRAVGLYYRHFKQRFAWDWG